MRGGYSIVVFCYLLCGERCFWGGAVLVLILSCGGFGPGGAAPRPVLPASPGLPHLPHSKWGKWEGRLRVLRKFWDICFDLAVSNVVTRFMIRTDYY